MPVQYPARPKQVGPYAQVGPHRRRMAPIGPSLLLAPKEAEAEEKSAFSKRSSLAAIIPDDVRAAPMPPKPAKDKKLTKQKFRVDQMYLLVGLKLGHLWVGRKVHPLPANKGKIELDWKLLLDEEERCGGIVGFWLPREKAPAKLSEQDVNTVRGWCACFGKSLVLICSGKKQQFCHVFDSYDTDVRTINVVTNREEEYVISVDKP